MKAVNGKFTETGRSATAIDPFNKSMLKKLCLKWEVIF